MNYLYQINKLKFDFSLLGSYLEGGLLSFGLPMINFYTVKNQFPIFLHSQIHFFAFLSGFKNILVISCEVFWPYSTRNGETSSG